MMLEVYRFSNTSSVSSDESVNSIMMKHSAPNIEQFEFNLGHAPQLRCTNTEKSASCECESCILHGKIKEIKQWFPRLGDHSRRRFMLGLMQRTHSADLLSQVVNLLQPMLCKDFIYSRSRINPSLSMDFSTVSCDRALSQHDVEKYIAMSWQWYKDANYWSKSNFALVLLQMCDGHLLHTIGAQARTLLMSEMRAAEEFADGVYTESSSIASTSYTYKTEKYPEIKFLATISQQYGQERINPFTGNIFHGLDSDDEIENDAGDEDFSEATSESSFDPAFMVIPTSAKAYAGVSKYVDFIRLLPVHISKLILSLLDKGSLMNALCVSSSWCVLVEEVHKDAYVNQQLWEEVMLMQGASAQGANPVYAKDIDVLVPNIDLQTGKVIHTDDAVIKTTFKSEVNFDTAYSGVSTRNVIMEERNVYCGPYNVLVLCDQHDSHRVFHTDGGKLIAIGSKDRKVRFVDSTSGREHKRATKGENADELPIITGHAGSIRCVCIMEEKDLVLSGSYDTSIRMWSINTGYCLKIFRGHRDTVLIMRVLGNLLISGSKDNSCKVWDMQTGKCQRSFRHHYPVTAVAMSADVVISGCEGGKVKVWNIKSGNLIKVLNGHHEGVTAIQFDRWHIVTGGRDGYALVWSAVGDHNRCLAALRHPKEVLCLEFMYLRCITGSADGRLRIWNIISGQCCRIMQGNSRSDPILNITAIDNRITINTTVNLLVLNFEKVDWNYNLEEDKVPPLVQYSSYSDAPVRQQPYPYIRAQRMKKAGASNTKILHRDPAIEHADKLPLSQMSYRAPQLPHSAKTLSAKSLGSAKLVQMAPMSEKLHQHHIYAKSATIKTDRTLSKKRSMASPISKPSLSAISKPPLPEYCKSRPVTSKSAQSGYSVTIMDESFDEEMDKQEPRGPLQIHRRVSWAFEHPIVPQTAKEISLSETKALLRSQIRMKSESIIPPDFIYLTVNAIQNSMKPTETSFNTEQNMMDTKIVSIDTRLQINRPSSSPGKIDPRTKIPVSEMDLSQFCEPQDTNNASEISDWKSVKSTKSKDSVPLTSDREVYSTMCEVREIKAAPKISIHPKHIRTTLPIGKVIRPISASVSRREPLLEPTKHQRPITAPAVKVRPDTTSTVPSQIAASMPGVQPPRRKQQNITSTGYEVNIVPMLMYPPDMKEKLKTLLREKRQQRRHHMIESVSESGFGKVSQYNDPMRSHVKFELRTHNQEQEYMTLTEKQCQEQQKKEDAVLERKKKVLWTAKAKGRDSTWIQSAPVGTTEQV